MARPGYDIPVFFLLKSSVTNCTRIGGDVSQIELPPNVEIEQFLVNRGRNNAVMDGVRMRLSNGTIGGNLNTNGNLNVFILGTSILSLLR